MRLRQRFRYHFDNLMARGVGAQILLLAVLTALMVVVVVAALFVLGFVYADDQGNRDSLGRTIWRTVNHTLDPGNLGSDSGSWGFLIVMLFATIGGLFVVSALIGVLNNGFGQMIDGLRRGKSAVVETNHTVILGWGPKIVTLLRELAEANHKVRDACVVILADRDKIEMDAEVAEAMKHHKLRVVTRSGSVMSTTDLALVSLSTSKAVIVLGPEKHVDGTPMAPHESDTIVLKSLLAIGKVAPEGDLHVVAEIFDESTEPVARIVAGERAALILAAPLISRLLVQTGRQSGLSAVYSELLDFEGVEIYMKDVPALVGKTFREAVFAYDTSTVIGVLARSGEMLVPPPLDREFVEGDQVVAISEDADTVIADGTRTVDDAQITADGPLHVHAPDRTLVLGTSPRLPAVLRELDSYVAASSEVAIVGEAVETALAGLSLAELVNMKVTIRAGDVTARALLDTIDITRFNHVLVLSETEGRTQELADARTTVTLLYLRDIERKTGVKVPITSEILEIENRDLAAIAEADDFIVSNTLVSLMVTQVAENPHLVQVFDELFSAGGFEIYLKPAEQYVRAGEVTFATISEAAMRRSEVAIGYRIAKRAKEPGFGVFVNPNKRSKVELGPGDRVIVLAED
jgi:voltage-gated potassium channel Kch